jgi:glutathione S-transferase
VLEIHGVPLSVHTRKVIVAAIAKNLPYTVHPVVPVIPGNPPANWRSISPTGLIPAITDGDFILADSTAICTYLDRTYPGAPLYPAAPRDHARALFFEQYAGGTVFRHVVHPLFAEVFVRPNVHQQPTDQGKVDAVLAQALPEVFGYLDTVAGDGFLVGPQMTIADVAVISNLITFQYIGFALDRGCYPRLAGLFDRVIVQPAMRQALQQEQEVVRTMGLDPDAIRAALD